MRGSETKKESEGSVPFCAKDEIRHLGAAEGRKVICRIVRADVH